MLSQDQTPPPKAVNIIRPSSPLFHYLKQRPSTTALNHHYQQQQQQTSRTTKVNEPPTGGASYSTSTSSSSSSPSTLSTLSGGSGSNGNYNKLPPPTILNSSSLGFGFFQAQQNSTTSPTWFKSSTSPPIPSHQYNTVNTSTTGSQISTTSTTNHKPLPTTGFMNSFSPRFFRVPQQSIDETTSFLRRQPSLSDLQDHHNHSSADQRIHNHNNRQQTDNDDDDDEDFDSIDGDTDPEDTTDTDGFLDDDDEGDLEASTTDSDYESQDNGDYSEDDDDALPIKVVARVKNGTIMNGKGEFVNKGIDDRASHSSWLDEARTNRKIADLEIEKTSLMALNATLESKVAQQEARIQKLEKQLHTNDWPLSPVSDKDMDEEQPCFEKLISTEILTEDEIANDLVFQRLRCMLLGLIDQAEEAVRQKTKSTGRVLTLYNGEQELVQDDVITLEGPPTLLKPSTRITPFSATQQPGTQRRQLQLTATQHKRPLRRVSDAQDNRQQHQQPSSSVATTTRKRTPMERSLSRASSPAVLVTTDMDDVSPTPSHALRPGSPRPFSPPVQRSSRPRPSHLRKSQDLESPKWHY